MKQLIVMAGLFLALLVGGCTPSVAPTPLPAPTPAAPASPLRATAPTPSSEEAAWAKVVEAAKKEGKITIYSFSFAGSVGQAMAQSFKESHGLSLEVVAGSGAVFMERLKMEARSRHPVGDILEGAATNGILAKQGGLSQSYGSLPVLREKGVWLFEPQMDPENHLIYYNPSIIGPWANTRLIRPEEEPRSWRDFLDPKWKGKIIVLDPDSMPTANYAYVLLTRYAGFDDEYFRTLGKQELIIAPNQRDGDSRLARGETPLALATTLVALGPMVADGAPVKPLDMKEGIRASGQALNMVAEAPHPNAARVFLNWLLSPAGQTANARIRSNLPLRTDVPDYTPQAARVKYTKTVLFTPKDDEESARVQRERILGRLWGR